PRGCVEDRRTPGRPRPDADHLAPRRANGTSGGPPAPAASTASTAALRQHVHDKAPQDGAVGRIDDRDGLEAERVEGVAEGVDAVVVVAEREVLRAARGVCAAEADRAAIAGDHVAEGVL